MNSNFFNKNKFGSCLTKFPNFIISVFITINEPVDYMEWAVMILMRGKDITRAIGRVGP